MASRRQWPRWRRINQTQGRNESLGRGVQDDCKPRPNRRPRSRRSRRTASHSEIKKTSLGREPDRTIYTITTRPESNVHWDSLHNRRLEDVQNNCRQRKKENPKEKTLVKDVFQFLLWIWLFEASSPQKRVVILDLLCDKRTRLGLLLLRCSIYYAKGIFL